MKMIWLSLLLCLVAQAMPRPVNETEDEGVNDINPKLTIFQFTEPTNKDDNDFMTEPTSFKLTETPNQEDNDFKTEPAILTLTETANQDDNDLEPVFKYIETANQDVDVFLREGDVAFDPFRSARKCKTCTWKKNSKGIVEVPFTIDPDQYSASDISLINESLKEFEVMTCVQFVNWTTQPDYLYIQSGSGCWSYIGRTGGKQTISLSSPSCVVYGVIQHEVMHSIGFFHEHTRVDRDDYINILWQNIAKGFAGNFNIDDGNTMNLPYDYESVMHYSANVYSIKPSLATMVPKTDPIVPIGQRSGLSSLDVRKMNAFYKCNVCREKLVKASGSFSGSSSSANQFGGNCLWLIQVPRNKIEVRFDFLNISSTDYVKVYDGMTKSSPVLLSETYGYGSITPLRSSGRNMLVEFVSVATSTFSTFNATYDAVPRR